MGVYKSPGIYTKEVDYWIPVRGYSSFNRKLKINKIFNLGIDFYDTFTSNYRKKFIIPVGNLSPSRAKKEITNLIRQYSNPIVKI
jgi:hypothetical protein